MRPYNLSALYVLVIEHVRRDAPWSYLYLGLTVLLALWPAHGLEFVVPYGKLPQQAYLLPSSPSSRFTASDFLILWHRPRIPFASRTGSATCWQSIMAQRQAFSSFEMSSTTACLVRNILVRRVTSCDMVHRGVRPPARPLWISTLSLAGEPRCPFS